MIFTPVFQKGNDKFVTPSSRFAGTTEDEAKTIGRGASFVECVIWDAKFTGDVIEVNDNTPHVEANLGVVTVALISGPLFDAHFTLAG